MSDKTEFSSVDELLEQFPASSFFERLGHPDDWARTPIWSCSPSGARTEWEYSSSGGGR